VANLLDMTRIEAGGDMFEFEVCHLADIATDSVARMNRSRYGHGRRIHVNVPPDLSAIYADPGQIGRVVDNLLSNALKYSEDDISVQARFQPASRTVRVEVSDRGPGIPAGQERAIFDRFARLKGAGRRGRQGSGLGLAICRSIITAHSGEIGVISSKRGSNFWFSMPIDHDDPRAKQNQHDGHD
jgi:signal transduction histidine kinase